ncbi:MAG: metallophosphoesterase family protein [Polyangiales bacterium]
MGCRRAPPLPSPPPPIARPGGAASALAFPHRPAGCGYVVHPPLAGHLRVSAHDPGAPARVRHLHLTVVGDAARTLVVQWNTDPSARASAVRYRPRGTSAWSRAEGFSFPLPGAASVRHHEVHLCGLAPALAYEYAVEGAQPAAAWHFRTAPDGPEPVTALVAGDARTHPEVWAAVAASAAREAPDVLLFTGDAVADGGSMALWARFFEAAEGLLATTPGYWVDGNHEGLAAVYYDQFALPDNGDADHREHWYAATWGPLRVVGLNDVTVPERDVAGPERDFLARALRDVDRARTPWVFTMHHQPMHTDAEGHRPDAVTRRAWGPLLDRYRVDVDLSGHVHNYESSEPMRADGTVVAEGAGTRYFVFGGAGAPLYPFLARGPWVHHREVTHGYALARVDAGRMTWEAHRADGSTIESLVVPWRRPPEAP